MDAFFVLADAHAQNSQNDLAFSARPNAPVLPYVAPRRRIRRLATWIRGSTAVTVQPAQCTPSRRRQPVQGRIVGWRE